MHSAPSTPAHAALTLAAALVLTLGCFGCGGSAPREAERGLVRVRVARLQMPRSDARAELVAERLEEFRQTVEACRQIEAFSLAAEAETYWARFHENRQEFDAAVTHYEEALRYDKLEHYRSRSELNPTANSAAMAVSLANLSLVKEKQNQLFDAIAYAERAFRINSNLNLMNRMKFDCARLEQLYARCGDKAAAESYRKFGEDLALNLAKPHTGLPTGLGPIPGSAAATDNRGE